MQTKTLSLVAFLFSLISLAAPLHAQGLPPHLTWAKELVAELAPANNAYASDPSYLEWAGMDGADATSARSVCSTFLTQLLMSTYDQTSTEYKEWMGSSSPNAARYHDLIVANTNFTNILNIKDVLPGDVLAVKYLDGSSSVSGHIALVSGTPVLRTSSSPIVADTLQYDVLVIDSARSGHGSKDTRRMSDGTWIPGVGQGTMRVYTDAAGNVQGYTWSTYSSSSFYPQSNRHLVFGRLQ